jgi:hypothetical protein
MYCYQTDIVYTGAITADAGQSTSFITLNIATRVISWTAPTVAGVYSVTITGKITNAGADNAVSNSLVLTVYSCATSIDTITITPSVATPVTMTLTQAISGA